MNPPSIHHPQQRHPQRRQQRQPPRHHPQDNPIPRLSKNLHIRLLIINIREPPLRALLSQKRTQRAPPLLHLENQELFPRHHPLHQRAMLQERFPQVLVAEIVPAPTLQHNLLVFVPGFDEVTIEVAEEAPGRPVHDGDDGTVHGSEPSVDGAVREDEFGVWVGG